MEWKPLGNDEQLWTEKNHTKISSEDTTPESWISSAVV